MESKEAVRERVRRFRERKRKGAVVQVGRPIDCLGCVELGEAVDAKDKELDALRKKDVMAPAGSCKGCSDRDTANAILRAKVLMLEKELGLLKRERKIEKQDEPKSPYRLGVGV